jgi:hypothetical protein
LRSTGYESVSLASLSVGDYPYLESVVHRLMTELEKQKISLSLSSLRPKGLTSEVVENIVRVKKTGFTLVPEAGTERLRAVINKCLKDDEIREAAENAFSQGWKRLKLYFMIGLPTEREEDLLGIVDVVKEIFQIGRKLLKKPPLINLSISSFIPKPHTPFQWLPMERESVLQEKFRFLLSRLKKYPTIRLKRDSVKRSVLEGIFSRGDRRLNAVLHRAWKMGARFDSWNDMFHFQIWEDAFGTERVDFHKYLSDLDTNDVLPWNHIDTGLKNSHLQEELKLALEGRSSPSCMEKDCAVCKGCSVSKFFQDKFDEDVSFVEDDSFHMGKKTEGVIRYVVSYRKIHQARYLSHMDLNNLIQQGFRRARIPVSYSKGFHPKMLISHPPALPLGMEGQAEWIEFKSQYIIAKDEFLVRINSCLPEGIEFFDLRLLDETEPSMNKKIIAFLYSFDLKSKRVMEAVGNGRLNAHADNRYFDRINKLVDDHAGKFEEDAYESIFVDEKKGKLWVTTKYPPKKGGKSQEIVSNIFNMENPVFFMTREQIIIDNPENAEQRD